MERAHQTLDVVGVYNWESSGERLGAARDADRTWCAPLGTRRANAGGRRRPRVVDRGAAAGVRGAGGGVAIVWQRASYDSHFADVARGCRAALRSPRVGAAIGVAPASF